MGGIFPNLCKGASSGSSRTSAHLKGERAWLLARIAAAPDLPLHGHKARACRAHCPHRLWHEPNLGSLCVVQTGLREAAQPPVADELLQCSKRRDAEVPTLAGRFGHRAVLSASGGGVFRCVQFGV